MDVKSKVTKMRHRTFSARIPEPLVSIIEEYLKLGVYVTPSDFLRDAIREKLKRDTPELYNSLFHRDMS